MAVRRQPGFMFPGSRSAPFRRPLQPPVALPTGLTPDLPEIDWERTVGPAVSDLTKWTAEPPLGQRIVISGRVLDRRARPAPNTLVEVWQANSAGRYIHKLDQWDAPLDPNFRGVGRAVTNEQGRYRFVTIRPGPYPWGVGFSSWRPAHIHFSLQGRSFSSRLVSQMYFPDDPLLAFDPIAHEAPAAAVKRMIARLDLGVTTPNFAVGYVFDIVLDGPGATPTKEAPDDL